MFTLALHDDRFCTGDRMIVRRGLGGGQTVLLHLVCELVNGRSEKTCDSRSMEGCLLPISFLFCFDYSVTVSVFFPVFFFCFLGGLVATCSAVFLCQFLSTLVWYYITLLNKRS